MTATAASFPLYPLSSARLSLDVAGGKGMNLAKLLRHDLPVPPGFVVPVSVYRAFVQENGLEEVICAAVTGLQADNPASLEAASASIRAQFAQKKLPPALVAALEVMWRQLGAPPVAVRSSATAEDLPGLSFAGQQDTFLNVVGHDALIEKVRACWSSLWTARAIGYRVRNGISHQQAGMAVVVQAMVNARASGVMFTANPVTGLRGEVVIEATLGLGEALVSGQVTPDRYILSSDNQFSEKTLGAKATISRPLAQGGIVLEQNTAAAAIQALPDDAILHLADMGRRIEALYGFPQDIEWAYTDAGELFILQSRPITSLYPLPAQSPVRPLSVFVGLHVVQGVMEPISPLGQDVLTRLLLGLGRIVGWKPDYSQQNVVVAAGERLWINVGNILRNPRVRERYPSLFSYIDPVGAQQMLALLDEPGLTPTHGSKMSLRTLWHVLRFLIPALGRTLLAACCPEWAQKRITRYYEQQLARIQARAQAEGELWQLLARRLKLLDESESFFSHIVLPRGLPVFIAGLGSFFGVLRRFSQEVGQPQLYLEMSRGLPHNVTTEMDLALWQTAQLLQSDRTLQQYFSQATPQELAQAFLAGTLPAVAQRALDAFMQRYGARGLGEIDIVRPRWYEQPQHVMQTLQSYLAITQPDQAPDVVFARGAQAARQAVVKLAQAVRHQKHGWFKSRLVFWAARRYRALGGVRESPKFLMVRMVAILRRALLDSAQDLVRAQLLAQPEDIFFMTNGELLAAVQAKTVSAAMRQAIARRRARRDVEMRRSRVPRLLFSDGRAFYDGMAAASEDDANMLRGAPVSPGVVEGRARVIFDPHATQLQRGEILICPGTDPAWTPLFLTAGGLVMEVGGMMTHGAVVAREYGIPAVVGVSRATQRLKTGQLLRVDGNSGVVELLDDA